MRKNIEGLHVLTDKAIVDKRTRPPFKLEDIVELSILGEASVIQLRDKTLDDESMIALGKNLISLIRGKIPLIVNDRVEVALAIEAQGIHIGQKDMPARQVRKIISEEMILGVSTHDVKQAKQAEKDGADYIGVGPIYPTTTKPDAEPPIGLKQLRKIKQAVSIPVIAIGGINHKNAADVAKIADGVAVISAIMQANDPKKATEQLVRIFNKYHDKK